MGRKRPGKKIKQASVKKTSRHGWLVSLVCIGPLFPWLVWDTGSIYPFFEPKYVVWTAVALLIGVLWLSARGKEYRVNWLDAVWAGWLIVSALSLYQLPDFRIGLPGLAQLMSVSVAYPIFRWFPSDDESLLRKLGWTMVVALEIQAIAITIQWIHVIKSGTGWSDNLRLIGTIGYHTFAAAFIVIGLPLLGLLLKDAGKKTRVLTIFVIIHSIGVLIMLQSRAAFLAGLLVLTVLTWKSIRGGVASNLFSPWWKPMAAMVIVLVIFFSGLALTHSKAGGMWARTLEDVQGSRITGRRLIWLTALEMAAQKPLSGVGLGGFYYNYIPSQGVVIKRYPLKRILPVREMVIWAHDEYLQEYVEKGLLGIAFFLLLLGGAIKSVLGTAAKREHLFIGLSLVAFLVISAFDFPLHRPCESILVFILLGLAGRFRIGKSWELKGGRRLAIPLLILILASVALWLNGRNFLSLRSLNSALRSEAQSNAPQVEEHYRRAIALSLCPGQPEAALGSYLCRHGELDNEIVLMKKALGTFRDTFLYENLGKACAQKGYVDEAREFYQAALDSGIRYSIDAVELSKLDFMSGRRQEALERLEALLKILPGNQRISLALGNFYYREARYSISLRILGQARHPEKPAAANLRAASLIKTGRTLDAEARLRSLLKAHPAYVPAWNNLGVLLYAEGRRKEAFEAFSRVLKIDPDNKLALTYVSKSQTF